MLVREVPGHPHRMTFGNIKFHLPIGLPMGKAVQVILQNLEINGGFFWRASYFNSVRMPVILRVSEL